VVDIEAVEAVAEATTRDINCIDFQKTGNVHVVRSQFFLR
jgi:hypothetical protein